MLYRTQKEEARRRIKIRQQSKYGEHRHKIIEKNNAPVSNTAHKTDPNSLTSPEHVKLATDKVELSCILT